ncbi:pyridoxamine 5'-phosphate oxidase [Xanthomonas hyacinthi]|uniref:Pyridoxine/pyridoxamine 5'-phosphate oxidase n=1 Tax=Xanthomonas hyacinthi TaxID=56455 RepID=A0A2S7F2F6_9XANT|nr:pyridoxamine 5'-phosphate oxidase [Xanthomonas hyacinthi]KLD74880.1 pyridoxine/pyridoxamine 5'-phosphate oxidase [Xanthomonas hyacinthi DSM 19077]PPU99624.1 pyridoxamine 5'-phosphate oxidase [Xanthomonas hyacinthi]QGY75756.1 pyridoxamine 5'-phosphate oxidase [Xanthomonas hyacinthi]
MPDLYAEALSTFADLFAQARSSDEAEYNAMVVASATLEARPSSRVVLLKSYDARGFVFYTHLDSQKGRELQANPQASLLFLWRRMREDGVQVRIDGAVQLVAAAEADAYFASRPRMSQIGAWASAQSRPLQSREEFEQRVAKAEASFEGREVPRPDGWGGFRVVPRSVEFWYGGKYRLHERWHYAADAAGHWSKRMLFP